ncbi:DUF3168 domain-containing protein [Moraxella catarrhalis]|nr:hypothetical protein [Moraxella phage Mcat18]AKI27810.1 hypothetical protein [Moraxella phage Mcat19]AKI27876.1 hypothetical protein [Moraxella phage Mcat21]AKI27921.1 hypothetical protein [Moraxella phage Mcat22]AKI27971.1 hypothetical protein [Moraxella phage Mcat23]AKI28271.1 hypothetical protein [Moraxella phage Mcat28]AKI28417.1 hypothetical protein [Moraxella phage Mcat31]EGE14814.1 hypothetical protein E9M_01168 [Moraxella catarrhalis 46P47B1]EGE25861.1 hypothetical protein E9W_03
MLNRKSVELFYWVNHEMNASRIIYEKLAPLVDSRVYPLFVPESVGQRPPYIVYQTISTQPDNTLDGITGHEWINIQIDVYHNDYDDMLALTDQVISVLDNIKPSEYGGCQYLYEDGLYRSLIEYGFWQTY